MKRRLPLIIAFVIAFVFAAIAYVWLKDIEKKASQQQIEMVKVLTAAKSIPARTIVEKDMIATKDIPKPALTQDMATKEEEVVGKVTISAIITGEVLLKPKFVEKGAQAGLAFIVPPGKRAVTITVTNTTGVAGLLKPGDFVDVISTFEVPQTQIQGETKPPVSMSITVLQNAQILALDTMTEIAPPPAPAAGGTTTGGGQTPPPPPSYSLVTLAISPKEAEKLTLLAEKSINRLALRPVKDSAITQTSGVTLDLLMGIAELPKPKKEIKPKTSPMAPTLGDLPSPLPPSLPIPSPLSPMPEVVPTKKIEIIRGVQVDKTDILSK